MLIDNAGGRASSISRDKLDLSTPYEAPRGELEAQIATIFAEVFEVDRVGPNDDFFELGGDSLLAETLSMAILEHTSREFEMSLLLEHGSPREIALLLNKKSTARSVPPLALQENVRPPIFIVHGKFGFTLLNPVFQQSFTPAQKLHIFELPGIRGSKKPFKWIEDIATAYIAQVNREYPEGPVLLASFCHGGLIALEMAAQLAEMGRPVRQLVLLDPGIPDITVRNYRRRAGLRQNRRSAPVDALLWLKRTLICAGNMILLGRWTDGSRDTDFVDEKLRHFRERKFKLKAAVRRFRGKKIGQNAYNLSADAQCKLLAAYRSYLPRQFTGPVTILSSVQYRKMYEDETHIWAELVPSRKVQVIAEGHMDLNYAAAPEAARRMQSIFDAASAEA